MFVVDDISLEFRGSCLSLDTDPPCQESASDENQLLRTMPSKEFAEQLTCKDAVSCMVSLDIGPCTIGNIRSRP